jgi:hypothetical protein
MLDQDYAFYREFVNKAQADDFAALLDRWRIPYQINQPEPERHAYPKPEHDKAVSIYLRRRDFKRANRVYEEAVLDIIEHINPDYYLFQFNTEELLEIVHKPDEWGAFDRILAKRILRERGVKITDEMADELYQERLKAITNSSSEGPVSLFLANLPGIIVGLLVSPLLGLFSLYNTKK